MKIQLTEEQIALLVKNETEKLQKQFETDKLRLEKKLEADVRDLERQLETNIKRLTGKYKFIEIDAKEKTEPKKLVKIDKEKLQQMVAEKKTVKEIAVFFKTTENSIRHKLWKMGIKLTDIKQQQLG